jgi:hypothetical protein
VSNRLYPRRAAGARKPQAVVLSQDYTCHRFGDTRPTVVKTFHDTWLEAEAEQQRLRAAGVLAAVAPVKPKPDKPEQLDLDLSLPFAGPKRLT